MKILGKNGDFITLETKNELMAAIEAKMQDLAKEPGWLSANEENVELYAELIKQRNELENKYPLVPDEPYKVSHIEKTCYACPAQWEGKTQCGKSIYARYRGGRFRLEINEEQILAKQLHNDPNLTLEEHILKDDSKSILKRTLEEKMRDWEMEQFFRKMNGGHHSYDGYLSDAQLVAATVGYLDFTQCNFTSL